MAYIRSGKDDFNRIGEVKQAFLKALGQAAADPNNVHNILNDDGIGTTETSLQRQHEMKKLNPQRSVSRPVMPAKIEEIPNETTNLTTPVLGPKEVAPPFDANNPAIKRSLGTDPPTTEKMLEGANEKSTLFQTVMKGKEQGQNGSPIPSTWRVTNNPKRKGTPQSKFRPSVSRGK